VTRALVVDDNLSLAEDLAEILASEGYEVLLFDDPQAALRQSDALTFDFALLDMRMPGLDGVTLQQKLAEQHPEARFALMTAYTEDAHIAEALACGVRRVLTKPVKVAELLRTAAELARGEHA